MSRKILVIDDHPQTVQLLELTLRRHGYTVLRALSGAEGIRAAEEHLPDLILLDIMMPDMDGLTVCRHLRAHATLEQVPVILFTAKTQVDEKREGFAAGATDYLIKPTLPSELISRIEVILSRQTGAEPGERVAAPQPRTDAPADAPCLLAVVGARGGAGTTTIALNMAVAMADNGNETLLVDLDTQQGHVGVYLGKQVERDLFDWLSLPPERYARELDRYLVEQDERLSLLLARPQLAETFDELTATQVAAMVDILRADSRAVVFDLGQNVGAPVRPLLEQASHILVCLRPERPALLAGRHIVHYLRTQVTHASSVHAIMLDFGYGSRLPRQLIENFLGFPLLDVIPLHPALISEAVDRSLPLLRTKGNGRLTQKFLDLARQVVTVQAEG